MGRLSFIFLVAAVVGALGFGQAVWEEHTVADAVADVLDSRNVRDFKDRAALERRVLEAVEEVVGFDEDNPIEIYLYHFQPTVAKEAVLQPKKLPKGGGVADTGESLTFSVLVARVWWRQDILFAFNRWTFVTQGMFADPNRVGSSYDTPDRDLEFVIDPSLIIHALQ